MAAFGQGREGDMGRRGTCERRGAFLLPLLTLATMPVFITSLNPS